MCTASKCFALLLVILFLTSLVTLQPATAKTTILGTNGEYPIPDENATIILLNGSSFVESNYYTAHNTSEGYVPSSWAFAIFSTGNGTIGLTISAHDCNVTIISYNYYLQKTEGYNYKTSNWLNYTITGIGTQTLDYSQVYSSNHSNTTVYLDDVARQQGDGWNWANFGITITGATSKVSIHNESIDFLPPRNAPHLEPSNIIFFVASLILVIVVAVFIFLLFRAYRKPAKQAMANLKTGCI
jgi:hypothetical protein